MGEKVAMKLYSEACERNKDPIFEQLTSLRNDHAFSRVLEVGSGTGQHAAYFSSKLDDVIWQPADLPENHDSIRAWSEDQKNLKPPLAIDLNDSNWTEQISENTDLVFTANVFHIVSWPLVLHFFQGLSKIIARGLDGGKLGVVIYGPFKYGLEHTSLSNRQFDEFLRHRDEKSGIRDFYEVRKIAETNNLCFQKDIAMPANNRLLIFSSSPASD